MKLYLERNASIGGESPRHLLQRIETSTSPTDDDVVDFESTVRKLRQLSNHDDLTILEDLQGAANEAEEKTKRTLRQSVTRTVYYRRWAYVIRAPFPPLQSITSVKYYDVNDTLQTVDSAEYSVMTPTRGQGAVRFDYDYSFPNINTDRPDPVQIVMVTGWGSADQIPASAKVAVRMLAEANYDGRSEVRTEAYRILSLLTHRGPV